MTRDGEASEAEANGQFLAESFKVVMSANANSEFTDLIHELGHGVAAYDGKGYRGLLAAIRDWYMENEGIASYEDAIEAIMDRYAGTDEDFTRADAEEEFFSEAMAGLFSTDDGAKQFLDWLNDETKADTNEKKSIIRKMADLLQDLFDHIKALIRGGTLSKTAEDFALMEADRAQLLRQEFLAALDTMKQNAEKGTKESSGAKFAIKYPKFTEAEIETNVRTLADMDVVYQVPAERLKNTGRRPTDIYKEYFNSWGNNVYSERFGDIAMVSSSAKSNLGHGTTPQKIAATEAIPTVIEDGQVVFSDVKPGTDVDRIVIAAPITIGEEHYYMGVMLQRDKTNQRLYMHDVTLEKETSGESQATLNKTGALDPEGRFFMKMLLQNAINVKYEMRRTKENNLQISEKDAQTAADIDRKVKHSLGIAAATDTEKSLASRVTELESVNRDLERQVKDYRLQMKAGGVQHVTDIRKVKQAARSIQKQYGSKISLDTLTNRMFELYQRIANADSLSWDAISAEAGDIAEAQKEKERRSDHERRSFW